MKKLLMVLLAVLLLSACSEKGPVVEGFVGRSVEDVYAWCSEIDPKYSCEVSYGENDEYEKDIVYEQSINAGKRLEDKISFKVSLGKAKEIVLPYITEDVTLSDIEVWKEAVGMENVKYVYETNDKIEKNHIIRMEPVTGVHKDTPITVYVSSGPAEPEQTTHEVVFGDYIGITVEEFEAAAKKLGLKPNHQESRDRYNPDVKFGNIAWHGSGVYEKDEVFNYGVCINAITVSPGQYVGKSEDEFIKIAKGLHLNPTRIAGRDAYSASIPKGYIVTHGNGVYVENEDFKYGVSYGPATVRTGYEGVTEDVFTEYLDMLELKGDRKTTDEIGGLSMGYYITRKAWDDEEKRDAAVSFVSFMTSDEVVSKFAGVSATALKEGAAPDTSEFNPLQVDAIAYTASFTGISPAVQDNLSAAAREPIFADMASIVNGDVDAADAVAAVLEANAE